MKIKRISILLLLVMTAAFLTACGDNSRGVVTGQYYYPAADTLEQEEAEGSIENATEENESQTVLGTEQFLIMENDMLTECLILEQIVSGKQYMYYYSLATRFLDKYGNRASVSYFDSGRVVTIGTKDSQGRVMQVQISNLVWEYPDVTRYSVDEERGVFKIADTKYSFDENLYVNSDGAPILLSELTSMDAIRVIGVDKKLLSVSVTTGHGELELMNTEIFEGSFIQIGNKVFAEITPDMKLDIPEGTYTITVANKGYGGSTEMTIERGQSHLLDLDTLKGEGPKYGNILFAVDVAGAVIQIDGKVVDYSEPISLQYGMHSLKVTAESYDEYSKKLFVNSSEATIVISLTGDDIPVDTQGDADTEGGDASENEDTSEGDGTTDSGSAGQAGSLAGSQAGSLAGGGSASAGNNGGSTQGSTENNTSGTTEGTDDTADYLSTISELLSVLSGINNESE